MHVGVAPRGPLRLEKQAHKSGYRSPDADGKLAPEVVLQPGQGVGEVSPAEKAERERLGLPDPASDPSTRTTRGFADGYESFAEELHTQIDVDELLEHLQAAGIEVCKILPCALGVMISMLIVGNAARMHLNGCWSLSL